MNRTELRDALTGLYNHTDDPRLIEEIRKVVEKVAAHMVAPCDGALSDKLPIWLEGGIGARLSAAMHAYLKEYVYSPDEGADHEPTDFERWIMEDMLNGALSDDAVSAVLQDAAFAILAATLRAEKAEARVVELEGLINTPETDDWLKGAQVEAAHQIERWGAQHDAGKSAWDWFWLIGYLSQKAAAAQVAGDAFKAKHHTISTAAALLNWHRHLAGTDQRMRPGIGPVERGVA